MSYRDWACLLALAFTVTVIAEVIAAGAGFYLQIVWGALVLTVTSL